MRAGFPHSDICGSKLVCQLPAAFRRLPRPSSPVIAKASTTCTYSLDPIALHTASQQLHPLQVLTRLHYLFATTCTNTELNACLRTHLVRISTNDAIFKPMICSPPLTFKAAIRSTSSSLLKNSDFSHPVRREG